MNFISTPQTDIIDDTFPFTVDKFPLTGPDGMKTDHYGLFRSDNMECVGRTVKKGFVNHTVDDIKALRDAGVKVLGEDAVVNAYWANGHVMTVQPGPSWNKDIGFGDNVAPRMMIYAGCGGAAFKYTLGLYRFLCLNFEMVAPEGLSIVESIRHTSGLRPKLDMLINKVDHLVSNWDNLVDALREMNNRKVVMADFLREVYPQREGTKTQTDKDNRRIEAIFTRLLKERDQLGTHNRFGKGEASAWEMLNAIQGYTQHNKTRKGNISKDLRAHLALTDPDVNRAMQLALAA